VWHCSLDGAGALGLVLHYLGSAMLEVSLQQIFTLIPATLNRYLEFAEEIYFKAFFRSKRPLFPCHDDFQSFSTFPLSYRHDILSWMVRLELLMGSLYLSRNLMTLSSKTQHIMVGKLAIALIMSWLSPQKVILILLDEMILMYFVGVIISAMVNCPGSWHDVHVMRPIFEQLRTEIPDGFYLVSDTAFPRGTTSIEGKICAPLKSGQQITAEPVAQEYTLAFNRQLLSYHQTAKWGMCTIQGSFGRLWVPLKISSERQCSRLIEICLHLTNVCACCVGISQIRNVYMPIWRALEDEQLWLNLGDMVFWDI